MQPHSASLLVI